MRILICAATAAEARACERGVNNAGLKFEILRTGVGFEKARGTLSKRLRDGARPDLIVSTGFAGSLTEDIPLHSWIVAKKVLSGERQVVGDKNLRASFAGATSCDLMSVPKLVPKRERAPMAVDMESAVLGELADAQNIPFLVLRFVTDTPASPLPEFIADFVSGRYFIGVRRVFANPSKAFRLAIDGARWVKLFEDGWTHHARLLDGLR